jgi:quinol monooxygenase YgiN
MGRMTLLVELEIKPDQDEAFDQVSKRLVEISEQEVGTLRYDWFVSADGKDVQIVEEFVDPAAFGVHAQNIADLMPEMAAAVTFVRTSVLGDVSAEARERLEGPGAIFYSPLRGFSR